MRKISLYKKLKLISNDKMDMKHVKYLALVLCIGNLSPVMAQTASKSFTVDNLVAWQRISGQAISE